MIVAFLHNDKTWHKRMEAVPRKGDYIALEGYTKFPLKVQAVTWSWTKNGSLQGIPLIDLTEPET